MRFYDALRARSFGRSGCCCFFAAQLALGCGSKGAVTLTAQIQNPKAMPASVALGTALNGSFDLVLDLGPEASKATTVTPGALALRNEATVLASSLAVDYGESPPFDVAVGGSKTVACTLDASKLLEASALDALCAGDVWYVATLTDTLSGASTVQSAKFAPSCP